MHVQKIGEAVERVIAQVLMVDGVVLQPVEQTDEIVRLRDEHAVRADEIENALDDRMNVLDMGEAVRRRHDARGPVPALHLGRHRRSEIARERRDATVARDLTDLGRLDAEDAVAAVLEVREQRAIVGADIDNEIIRGELEQGGSFRVELGEIVAQQLGGAAGVGIFGREDDDGIDCQAELHQVALGAVQEMSREPRLLPRHLADRDHLVHWRHVAEREHVGERRVTANLAAFHRDAGSAAGSARDFCRKRHHLLLRFERMLRKRGNRLSEQCIRKS
jgi:hypothetical protein